MGSMVGRVGGFAAPLMIELQFIDGTLIFTFVKSKPSLDYLVFNMLPPRWLPRDSWNGYYH